jgi:single-stranded-DNA-specific exonuclease
VCFDEDSLGKSIDDILKLRFSDQDLSQTLDDLHDPYLLTGMQEAVERIKTAHVKHERVIVFGDYDVDGVTSTAILMHFFKKIGMQVSYRLPHRVKDGYGLKNYFIDDIHAQ